MFASQSVNPQLRVLALFRPFIAHLHNYMCIAYRVGFPGNCFFLRLLFDARSIHIAARLPR